MTIWMRRLLIASSLMIGLIALVQVVYIWSHQTIQLPVIITTTGQALDSRNALWWTLEQLMPTLYAVQWVMIALWIVGTLTLGALTTRHATLERRWAAAPPFIIALVIALIGAGALSISSPPNLLIKISFTLMFALGWIALAFSLRLKLQPRAAPDLPSPRV